jgi:multiple sugar transport system substrate-binding protein
MYASLMDGAAGEAAPGDILALDPLWVSALAGKGVLEGEFYPLLTYISPLFYNIDILRAAGFSRPPKTRDEFLSMARAVRKLNRDLYGIALSAGADNFSLLRRDIYPWVWAAGATLFAEGRPRLTEGPFVAALEFLGTLNNEGFLVPGSFSWDEDQQREAFIKGKTVFMIAPVMEIEALREAMGGSFGVSTIPVPGSYASRPVFGTEGWGLGISSRSKYKEEAKIFIAFLLEQSGRIAAWAHAIPGNGLSPAAGEDPLYTKVSDMCVSAEFLREFEGLPAVGELEERFRFFMAELLQGRLTASAAAEQIQGAWEELLAP